MLQYGGNCTTETIQDCGHLDNWYISINESRAPKAILKSQSSFIYAENS